jgi:hypothetical protein
MKISFFLLIVVLFLRCKNESEVTVEMVAKKLDERRREFIKEREEDCHKLLMKEIEEKADSILIYTAKKIKYDSLTIPHDSIRPEKPEVAFPQYKKPEKPEDKIKVDSIQSSSRPK